MTPAFARPLLSLPPLTRRMPWPPNHWVVTKRHGPSIRVEQSDRLVRAIYQTDCCLGTQQLERK